MVRAFPQRNQLQRGAHYLKYRIIFWCLQGIFLADEEHYTGLVFAGLASLKLGEYEEARKYYRRATGLQAEGPLAWKVLYILHATGGAGVTCTFIGLC